MTDMKTRFLLHLCVSVVFVFAGSLAVAAQTDAEMAEATVQALHLFEGQKFAEAIPHFEVLIKGLPENPQVHFMYGFCLIAKSKQVSDPAEGKQLSAKGLEQLVLAKKLGLNAPELDGLIAMLQGTAVPGAEPQYSQNKDAEKAMVEGESFFVQSNYDEAIKKYELALSLDPKIYRAALSGGDSFVQKNDWASAEKWYQRAIATDPDRETAYRYSATPLMKQKKFDLARDRYIEAFITEPYSNLARGGIGQWAEVSGATLGHPIVEVPQVTFDAAGKAVPKTAIKADDASAKPWLDYLAVREAWKKTKFSKTFPKETAYRHTMQEETEALRAAVAAAVKQKSPNLQFELLGKMDKDGVLEPFVLLALVDEGIAADHPQYLKTGRPQLRQYVVKYLIH
jgi:tetratricopeptide (TPR) repeat protein